MMKDLRYSLRQLRKSPGFAMTAVLTLALGIGANTAIFTLINSIMLRPLPYPQQDRLVRINYGGGESETAFFPVGWIHALGEHSRSFASVSGFGPDAESNVGDNGTAERVFGAEVVANALDVLGLHPALGRFFTADDARAEHDPVVILSYGYWRQHFAASPAVLGESLRIDGVSRRIIGVMPAGVRFPYAETRFVVPVTTKGGDPLDPWKRFDLRAFGRLRPGITPVQAQGELRRLQRTMLPLFPYRMPDIWASDMAVVPLLEAQIGALRPRLYLLFGAVGLVLLIACANVANLMLARAAGREREVAIRGALGASTNRLVRQFLCESLVLAALAGVVGLIAAAASLRLLIRALPADTPRLYDVSLQWPVFVFAAGAALLTGFCFGLVPALHMAAPSLRESLHSGSRSVAGKAGQFRTSMALVTGQIALSVIVITTAGLMLHSLWSLSQVDPGFRADRIVTAEVSLDSTACQEKGRCQAFYQTLLDRLHGLPGEEDVALTDGLPLTAREGNYVYDAEGHPRGARQGALVATSRAVSPEYFATLGISLLRGRLLTPEDASGSTRAVVINQRMADRLWPHQDPLGRHLLPVAEEPSPAVWNSAKAVTVAGVVGNTHEGTLASGFGDEVYLPMTAAQAQPVMYVLLRTGAGTEQAAAELRQAVASLDPGVPVTRVRALNEVVAASESASRSTTALLLAFGTLALIIGGVGVYSLIACIVSWRMREFGIRLALGAQRSNIIGGVVRQSLTLALMGSALGLLGSALAAHLLRGFLFDVKTLDPYTFGAVPMLMIVLALGAAWVPALRAASVDPVRALRAD